jgi:hypothetical protein
MKREGSDFFCISNTFSHITSCSYNGNELTLVLMLYTMDTDQYKTKETSTVQYSAVLVMHCIIRLPPLELPQNFTSQISHFYFMYTISIIIVIIYKFIFSFYRFKEANGGVPFDPPKVEAPKKEPAAPVEKGPSKKCKEIVMLYLPYGCDRNLVYLLN